MSDLFIDKGAIFNSERTHRQKLWRIWGEPPFLYVIGMNPSYANEDINDPTVGRCQKRAEYLNMGGLIMLNIQDVVETDSLKLDHLTDEERCTRDNLPQIKQCLIEASKTKSKVLCAWGNQGHKYGQVKEIMTTSKELGVELLCLGQNANGAPVHPLYQPYNKKLTTLE